MEAWSAGRCSTWNKRACTGAGCHRADRASKGERAGEFALWVVIRHFTSRVNSATSGFGDLQLLGMDRKLKVMVMVQ